MSKNVAMFVDVANMYYAARGQDVDVDYVALLKHATKGRDLIRAYAYTGLDPENENQRKFIDFLGKNGYKPVVKDIRKFGDGRMKANLDIELVVDLFRLADRMDIAVIVSGDGDFAPAIRALQDTGVRCEVISFKPNTSSDLIAVADEFMDIMKVASISRGKAANTRTSMSAPEMPAKEVSPEFGFREASPSVAAAALAAIKGGGAGTAGNGRRRGGTGRSTTSRRSASASEAAEESADDSAATATTTAPNGADTNGEDGRRRRRRRGGRGRGRSRREGEAPEGESTSPDATDAAGDIGWEEFDDLSQLDAAEPDREYSFEEADPATLAELGIEAVGDEPEPEKPKRSRARKADADGDDKPRRRTRKAASDADAAGDASAEEKPKRSRARKADADAGEGEEKAPRRRTRKAASDSDAGGDDAASASGETLAATADDASPEGEPQGIWGRFRSARKPRTTG